MMNVDKNIKNIIDSRLSHLKISNELENKLLNPSLHKKRVIGKPMAVALIFCICIMITIPVMAAKSSAFIHFINEIDPQIALLLQPIEQVSEDNGIKMELLAAMNDEETAIIYFTMQDISGERIDRTLDLYHYSMNGTKMFTHELVDFDEATKTATIKMTANGGNGLNGKKVTFRVHSFLSGKEFYRQVDTHINLAEVLNNKTRSMTLDVGNIPGGGGKLYSELEDKRIINVLEASSDMKSIANVDFVQISNIGYIDERLHVQTKWIKDIDNHGHLYLINERGERIDPTSLNFGMNEDGQTIYGNEYVEYIFDVEPAELLRYVLYGDFVKNNNYTEGRWEITFKLNAVEEGKKIVNNIEIGRIQLEEIIIQSMGINIVGNVETSDQLAIEMTMKDGTKVFYNQAVVENSNDKLNLKYFSDAPIKLDNIKEILINGTVIPID